MTACDCNHDTVVSQCKSCGPCGNGGDCIAHKQFLINQRQRIIQKVVRIDSSQYAMNKACANVYQKTSKHILNHYTNSNQSDRVKPAGLGVDVKHGSYERYLARKKGKTLQSSKGSTDPSKFKDEYDKIINNPKLTTGGKLFKFSIISNNDCYC